MLMDTVDETRFGFNKAKPVKMFKCRFSLEFKSDDYQIGSRERTLLVLMKNPSLADGKQSDPTINRLLKLQKGAYERVIVVNLTPIVTSPGQNPDSKDEFMGPYTDNDVKYFKDGNRLAIKDILTKLEGKKFDLFVATGSLRDKDGGSQVLRDEYGQLMGMIGDSTPKQTFAIFNKTGNYGTLAYNKFHELTSSDWVLWDKDKGLLQIKE